MGSLVSWSGLSERNDHNGKDNSAVMTLRNFNTPMEEEGTVVRVSRET